MEYRDNGEKNSKVLAFDLDGTLLIPKGSNKFPKGREDAKYAFEKVPEKIKYFKKDGYRIVIFTNQKNRNKEEVEDIFFKVNKFFDLSSVSIFISLQNDYCRKPLPGMYDFFKTLNGPVKKLIYVGDAAGRPGDFSDSDLKFATNIGSLFFTPEHFFEHDISQSRYYSVDRPYPQSFENLKPTEFNWSFEPRTMILQVGMPGCGKSTLSQELIRKYPNSVIISNDKTRSLVKSLRLCQEALQNNVSLIIIDNTNPSSQTREKFTELAKNANYSTGAIVHSLPIECAQYLNKIRCYKKKDKAVPEVAYRVFKKHFEYPTGYNFIIDWIPEFDLEKFNLFI